ncbi:hypothetical protein JKP88DRAFT_265911 [Tribonema minus]|uniref:Uncharacterized protein n=1 Tax=Tribonema minus TaxID=303371 RepID=A0A836C7T6_9STRA|nr:hypothetical protein JKP88DRAFT_265911 [Tribonema minus]
MSSWRAPLHDHDPLSQLASSPQPTPPPPRAMARASACARKQAAQQRSAMAHQRGAVRLQHQRLQRQPPHQRLQTGAAAHARRHGERVAVALERGLRVLGLAVERVQQRAAHAELRQERDSVVPGGARVDVHGEVVAHGALRLRGEDAALHVARGVRGVAVADDVRAEVEADLRRRQRVLRCVMRRIEPQSGGAAFGSSVSNSSKPSTAFAALACASTGALVQKAKLEGEAEPLTYSDGMPARALSAHMRKAPSALPKRKYTYVIIGSGTTASAAIESILNLQPDADILLLTDETASPAFHNQQDVADPQEPEGPSQMGPDLLHSYNEWRRQSTAVRTRPPPAPADISSRLPDLQPGGYGGPVTVAQRAGIKIDADRRRILLDDGSSMVYYDKCLIACPGKPRRLYALRMADLLLVRPQVPFKTSRSDRAVPSCHLLLSVQMINTLSDLEDFQALESLKDSEHIKHVTVIGGGFLGSEVALALARRGGLRVSQVYAEVAPMQRLLPAYLAMHLQRRLQQEGVEPIRERLVTDLRFNVDKGSVELVLQGWEKQALQTDYIVLASTHIEPRVGVATASGIEVDRDTGGVVVNGQFEAVAGVYAAGGVASYYDAALGRRRIDRYDHSVNSGLLAGYNMAAAVASARAQHGGKVDGAGVDSIGRREVDDSPPPGPFPCTYTHQPMLRSTLSGVEVCMEGLGEIDARLRTVGLWLDKNKTPARHAAGDPVYRRGLVYYLRGDKVVGILLWNTTDLLERAREVLRTQPKITSIAQCRPSPRRRHGGSRTGAKTYIAHLLITAQAADPARPGRLAAARDHHRQSAVWQQRSPHAPVLERHTLRTLQSVPPFAFGLNFIKRAGGPATGSAPPTPPPHTLLVCSVTIGASAPLRRPIMQRRLCM